MPNPHPVQNDLFKQKRWQRVMAEDSCVPPDTPLAHKALGVRLPVGVDAAIRAMGKQKAAWIRETLCQAALEQNLVDKIE